MPQHEPVPVEEIVAYAETPRGDGTLPSRIEVAARFGINVVTVNKALLTSERRQRTDRTQAKDKAEAERVLEAITLYSREHGWAPSQREIADVTGYVTSRVNYLLKVLEVEGLIELGPAARQIRVVGSKMVIPSVTL